MDHFNPRILISPGPFKECLDSEQIALAMSIGVNQILPNAIISIRPICDGGSGIVKLLTEANGGKLISTKVLNPIGNEVEAKLGLLSDGKTIIIESAQAAGLNLIPKNKRNPLNTSTFGVGQLIMRAMDLGAKKIIIGCGDSGTNDCGIGCASALGVKFEIKGKKEDTSFLTGSDLANIVNIDYKKAFKRFQENNVEIIIACNLTSVLCGDEGTSIIYGPQKGANPEQVQLLHKSVNHYVNLIYNLTGIELSFIPGAGAAGGLASSLYAFFNAKLIYSIDLVDQFLNLDNYLSNADLVLTGEGQIDDRTATGKVACGLALKSKKYNLPVIAIVGKIAKDHEDVFYNGIDAIECIADEPISKEESIKNAYDLISKATARVMRFVYKIPHKK